MMLIIAGLTEPFIGQTANRMELVNEAFVLVTNYHLFMFTNFLSDLDMREKVGTSLIITTCLNVIVDLGVVTIISLITSVRKLKLKYLEWRQEVRLRAKKKAMLD